jgi:polyphosphate kinase
LVLIALEAEHARQGRTARIISKMNGLTDKTVIQELYKASQAGVAIDLIVRGICALRPGIRGVSKNIRVRSIVGRFLEHSRMVFFQNGGDEEVYVSSADWMARNLYDRVETAFPIKDPFLRSRIREEILESYLQDNAKARILQPDGTYVRAYELAAAKRGKKPSRLFSAQDFLMSVAEGRQEPTAVPHKKAGSVRSEVEAESKSTVMSKN